MYGSHASVVFDMDDIDSAVARFNELEEPRE